ncbi:MAG: tetratricopeptide repeat protein, partial [Planctomycetales bacterium]
MTVFAPRTLTSLSLCLITSLLVLSGCGSSERQAREAANKGSNVLPEDERQAREAADKGSDFLLEGEHDQAIAELNRAIELKPDFADAYLTRGAACRNKGETDEARKDYFRAIRHYNEAIRLSPQLAITFHNRGVASWRTGEYEKAMADFRKTVRLHPRNPGSRAHLAVRLAICPDEDARDVKQAV